MLPDLGRGPSPNPLAPWSLAYQPRPPSTSVAPYLHAEQGAETQASEASQIGGQVVASLQGQHHPAPASVISCLVNQPKPSGMGERRRMKWLMKESQLKKKVGKEKKKHRDETNSTKCINLALNLNRYP